MTGDVDAVAAATDPSSDPVDPSGSAPVEQPPLPVLVFDGDCGFCTASAQWAQRRLRLDHVEPWQVLDLRTLGLTEQECKQAAQFVRRDRRVFAGEMAVAEALIERGGWWRTIGRAMHVPGVRRLSGVAYRLIARNRHRLPGSTPACRTRR